MFKALILVISLATGKPVDIMDSSAPGGPGLYHSKSECAAITKAVLPKLTTVLNKQIFGGVALRFKCVFMGYDI